MFGNFDPIWSLALAITLVTGLSCHEFGHAMMATRLGDPTPRMQGRLTLNPAAHLDTTGAILLLVMAFVGFGFAYGKPVQTNPTYFSSQRQGMTLVALAGPAMNLCLVMLTVGVGYILFLSNVALPEFGSMLLFAFIYVNVLLMVFNLIPVPPLDGSHVVMQMLSWRQQERYQRIAGFGILIIIGLWITGVLGMVIGFFFNVILIIIQLGFGPEYVDYLLPR
jgi:Zn-dependent protease